MEIGQFTKDIRHIAGLKNVGSDFLSRLPPSVKGTAYEDSGTGSVSSANVASASTSVSPHVMALEGQKLHCMSPAVVFDEQQTCPEIQLYKTGKHPTSVTFSPVMFGDYELYCENSLSKPRPVLPKQLRTFVIKQMHFCHQGIKETVRSISSEYYWSEMKKEITNYVQTCHSCQSVKPSTRIQAQ